GGDVALVGIDSGLAVGDVVRGLGLASVGGADVEEEPWPRHELIGGLVFGDGLVVLPRRERRLGAAKVLLRGLDGGGGLFVGERGWAGQRERDEEKKRRRSAHGRPLLEGVDGLGSVALFGLEPAQDDGLLAGAQRGPLAAVTVEHDVELARLGTRRDVSL